MPVSNNHTDNLIFANDVGFSSLKGGFYSGNDWSYIKVPSKYLKQYNTNSNPVATPIYNPELVKNCMDNIFNNMSISIENEQGIPSDYIYYVGNSASGPSVQSFKNKSNNGAKNNQSFTRILTYAVIANKALKDFYNKNHKLPLDKPLTVNVSMATALPESEARQQGVIPSYAKNYLYNDQYHIVHIHNFANNENKNISITVKIKFINLFIGFEGQAGDFAIEDLKGTKAKDANKSPILASLLKQLQHYYKDTYDYVLKNLGEQGLIDKYLTNVTGLFNVDIGDVTTDCVGMIKPMNVDVLHSDSINDGCHEYIHNTANDSPAYTTPEVQAIVTEHNKIKKGLDFNTRNHKDFQNISANLNRHANGTFQKIADGVFQIFNQSPRYTKIYVFGGGSIPASEHGFRDELKANLTQKNSDLNIPILFISQKYAQKLNLMGLEHVAVSKFTKND